MFTVEKKLDADTEARHDKTANACLPQFRTRQAPRPWWHTARDQRVSPAGDGTCTRNLEVFSYLTWSTSIHSTTINTRHRDSAAHAQHLPRLPGFSTSCCAVQRPIFSPPSALISVKLLLQFPTSPHHLAGCRRMVAPAIVLLILAAP